VLSLIHVSTFLAVVDARGFRPAARRLALAASTVVAHVDQLEADLGAALLVRDRGQFALTAHGQQFEPLARALIDTAGRCHAIGTDATIRVAAATNVGVYLLQPKLASFAAANGIAIEPWIGCNAEAALRLRTGRADVAVMEWWDGHGDFEAATWRTEPLVVIAPPWHPWARRGAAISPADLLDETILGGETGTGTGRVLRRALGPLADRLTIRTGYGSTEAVKRAVRAGHGVSIVLAAAVTDEIGSDQLAAVRIGSVALEKEIACVTRKGLASGHPAKRFAGHLFDRTATTVIAKGIDPAAE
jgi:DNA-binding transcriptional LysR family regulator